VNDPEGRRDAGSLPAVPRVRVVVLNFNGGELTLRALRAVQASAWPEEALETVLVDNASSDGVADAVEHDLPTVRVIRSDMNRGFAGGTNLGIGRLDGIDAVALVNNDVTVPENWLPPLVDALRADGAVGAASPKMLLEGQYRRVELAVAAEPVHAVDLRARGIRVVEVVAPPESIGDIRYVKGFFEPERLGDLVCRRMMPEATLFVPVPPTPDSEHLACTLVLDTERAEMLAVRSGGETTRISVQPGMHSYTVDLRGETFDVVNNVGSELLPSGYGADRGWLEPDHGQYDQAEDVFAWSGGAVLLRAGYLRDTGLFDERLFLYYEDLELSWRGRRRGWRYRYVPGCVVRHAHAATAKEDSLLARYFNERNRLLVLARHAPIRQFLTAVLRYLLSTASYARRDVVAPVLRGERPRPEIVATRIRSFADFVVRVPSQLRDRNVTGRNARRRGRLH